MQIPFSPPYIDEDIVQEVTDCLRSGWITTGPKVNQLQKEVADYCGVQHTLAVNSATSALMLVLHWFGVTHGDEVIVPAYTYCATALAVIHIGAKPVMVDIRSDFNIDPAKVKLAITEKTKAIISVDFAGWPCDYDALTAVINDPQVKQKFNPSSNINQQKLGRMMLLADAAHSIGAVYNNRAAGTLADMTVFSFHAVKNVTTAEGGIICINMPQSFNNNEIYSTLRLWSLNGQTKDALSKSKGGSWKYDIIYPGFKMNMPDVLAAIGIGQLTQYGTMMLMQRKRVFDYYAYHLKRQPWAILPPFNKPNCSPSFHLYPLQIANITEFQRDAVIDKITSMGVAVNVHFIPMPLLTVFKNLGYNIADYPQAYLLYSAEISLPIYPQLTDEQCSVVTNAVIKAVNSEIAKNG